MNWLAAFFTAHQRSVAVVVAVVTVLAAWGTARVEFNDEPRTIFRRDDDEFARLEQMYADFGADDNDVLLVIDGERLFTGPNLAAIREMVRQVAALPGVERVNSIFDIRRVGSNAIPLVPNSASSAERFEQAERRALKHPLVAGQILSADGKTMLVVARLRGNASTVNETATDAPPTDALTTEALTTDEMAPVLKRIREIADNTAGKEHLTVRIAGHPSLRVDTLSGMRGEMVRSMAFSALTFAILGILLFRRATALVITLAGPCLGVLWTMGVMGWLGEKVNGLNSAIPTIVFTIGFTDAVHMMVDYRHRRGVGDSAIDAASRVIRDLGLPCLLTALTTAVGFGSLLLAHTTSVQRFGVFCGIGTLLTFVCGLAMFPLLASVSALGDRSLLRRGVDERLEEERHHWLRRVVGPVVAHPRIASLISVLLCLIMAPSPFQLTSDIQWTEAIPADSDTSLAMRECDRAFGGALLAHVLVDWPDDVDLNSPRLMETLRRVHACIAESHVFAGPFSVLNLLEALPAPRSGITDHIAQLRHVPEETLHRVVRPDLHRLAVTAHVPDAGAIVLVPALAELDAALATIEQQQPGFHLHLTGTVVVAARNVNFMVSDLGNSLGFEAVAVFILMAVGFRSIYLGVMSMIPNLFPLLVTATLLVWTDQRLTLTSALAFNLCLGLAVDDTIHFLLRLERERRVDGDLRAAVLRTFDGIGIALVTTTPILIGGFATLLLNGMPAIRLFAQLSCVTLLAALVGDLFVLPALLLCFARRSQPSVDRTRPPI